MALTLVASNATPADITTGRSEEERLMLQKIARAIDPDVWAEDIPVPTAAATVTFHRRRIDSLMAAVRVMGVIEDQTTPKED